MSGDVASRLAAVQARVAAATARSGRRVDSVELLTVSKLQSAEAIEAAYAAGARSFGENYAQELRDKADALKHLGELRWHAIGHLQPNKAKYVAKAAHSFHALDRLEVAVELSKRRSEPLGCYVEVNLGKEQTKGGVAPADLSKFLDEVRGLPQLQIIGLMSLPPLGADAESSRPYFKELFGLAKSHGVSGLSMGTTHDFEVAIEEGATIVRVGTAIFGERA